MRVNYFLRYKAEHDMQNKAQKTVSNFKNTLKQKHLHLQTKITVNKQKSRE